VSGTLNTAKWTSELNRDLYATSCFPDDHFYQGNIKLLSKRNTEKYPIADSFFSIASFGKTWPELENPSLHQTSMHFNEPKSEFQRWVLELQNGNGECLVQTLMNYASKKGYTLGKFYHLFEAEVEAGLLRHDSSGRVEAIL
jgi:predicted Rossmann fold nucleotide-binding protein DprA/Smf involved in DNA uptake